MAEFDEVNRTSKLASEDTTIVIGTVLDPEMQDDVRVTWWRRPEPQHRPRHRAWRWQRLRPPRRRPCARSAADQQQGKRDGTTGMLDDVTDAYNPGSSIAANLRGRRHRQGRLRRPRRSRISVPTAATGHPCVPASPGGLKSCVVPSPLAEGARRGG